MNQFRNKRIWMILLICAFLLITAACSRKAEDSESSQIINSLLAERSQLQTELEETKASLNETRRTLESVQSAPKPTPVVVVETKEVEVFVTRDPGSSQSTLAQTEYAVGVDCTVNGQARAALYGITKIVCSPVVPEGMAFDHWEVNGKRDAETKATLELSVSKSTVIRAVLHEKKIVKCINCYLEFLDAKNNAKGSKYTEFDFENEYKNPVTGSKCKGGLIDFYLFASVPRGMQVDYWLINGVKYQPPSNLTKFRVVGLDEATVYEVVFKKASSGTPVPGNKYVTPVG